MPESNGSRLGDLLSSIPLITRVLLALNISIHGILFVTSFPTHSLAINPLDVILRGESYRLVSSAFVHGGALHLLMNMGSLAALGPALEHRFGSVKFLLLTLWSIVLCGCIFVAVVWTYSVLVQDPGARNNSAVGYSGVLFAYAMLEAFHSTAPARSVFGVFSVPSKLYPLVLLVVIQVVMPNISLFGHLAGVLVGALLMVSVGEEQQVFLPSTECCMWLEEKLSRLLGPVGAAGSSDDRGSGYVRVRSEEVAHPLLGVHRYWIIPACAVCIRDEGNGGAAGAIGVDMAICASLGSLLWQIYTILATALHIVGVPVERVEACGARTGSWLRKSCCCCCHRWLDSAPSLVADAGDAGEDVEARSPAEALTVVPGATYGRTGGGGRLGGMGYRLGSRADYDRSDGMGSCSRGSSAIEEGDRQPLLQV